MTGIEFLVILAVVLIAAIICIFIFQTYNFMSLKSYHEKWEPIYENRKEHFDKYLKYALEHREKHETIENVAGYAASMRIDSGFNKEEDYYRWKNYYIHELRSANIE